MKLAEKKRSKEKFKQDLVYAHTYSPYQQNDALFKRAHSSLSQGGDAEDEEKENVDAGVGIPAYFADTFNSRQLRTDGQSRRRARSLSANNRLLGSEEVDDDASQKSEEREKRPSSSKNLIESVKYDLQRYRSASVTRLEEEKKNKLRRAFLDEEIPSK